MFMMLPIWIYQLIFVLMFVLIGVALAVGIYLLVARRRLRPPLRHLWRAMRAHWLIAGLLAVCGVSIGVKYVIGGTGPMIFGYLPALACLAGVCAGWWEARRDAAHPYGRVFDQGLLAGLLASGVAVLVFFVGDLGLAWRTGWFIADPARIAAGLPHSWGDLIGALLLAAGTFLGAGVICGVLGAFAGMALARLPGLFQRGGPAGPVVPS